MDKRHKKRCSESLIIKEMHIKTTIRYHLTAITMAIIKTPQTVNAVEVVKRREPSHTVVGM